MPPETEAEEVRSTRDAWPVATDQVLFRTEDGRPPAAAKRTTGAPEATGRNGVEWERVWRLSEVENLYDLGFWGNLKEIFVGI